MSRGNTGHSTASSAPVPSGMMTLSDAREYLGVTWARMTAFARSGALHVLPDVSDKRRKLVRREEVERYTRLLRTTRMQNRARGAAWRDAHPTPPGAYPRKVKVKRA